MKSDNVLSDEIKSNIKKAVRSAEKKSGGEIVVYVAEKSDTYSFTYPAGGFLGFFLGSFLLLFLYYFSSFISSNILIFLSILFILPVFITALLYFIKPLHLFFINKNQLDYFVHLKAKETFVNEQVFNTKERNGVLIYISLFEKKVVVLGDSGINKKIKPHKWDAVVQTIVKGIREDSLGKGIISGIMLCGDILKDNNIKRRVKDKNELKNGIRFGGKK